ncbi:hypothetical protein TeGR_g10544 [Tetraparma gracilis]|uniref:Uricase n=1 Tax=Tetraparma gracilis TaxID=2962635 RepID=A0ABQ6MZ00_9STRA|nr:hypothetical protein TeGR_g10544 [Tetraparma gracilis]
MPKISPAPADPAAPANLSSLRTQSFPLKAHNHGKAKVRVMKVVRSAEKHFAYEYSVDTTLFSPEYEKVFTAEDNSGLVATDTQKNTVYVIAKRTEANSPEQFGIDLCKHFISEYPVLTAAQAEVRMTLWERAVVDGEEHEHGWIKQSPEQAVAVVKLVREGEVFSVRSFVKGMTIFKSTQSGFADYHMDKYTLLPPCTERCLSTELTAEWGYTDIAGVDFADARAGVRAQLIKGIFGPAKGGVFSVSLQATIYDAGCLVLTEVACVSEIKIDTPNKHYLPYRQLEALGEVFEDDIFVPTDEPSGTITCTVARE